MFETFFDEFCGVGVGVFGAVGDGRFAGAVFGLAHCGADVVGACCAEGAGGFGGGLTVCEREFGLCDLGDGVIGLGMGC